MNKFSSVFAQILQLFPKYKFHQVVKETNSEKHAKGFTSWAQFVAMLFCQLGQAQSLREICGGLASCFGKLKHLGINSTPKRSTLSYANNKRPWQLYSTLFDQLLAKFQEKVLRKKKFRFKNKLYSLDSTIIELCASLFDWAKFRTTKGAVKLHLLLDHDGYLPVFANVTEGKVHDVNIARTLSFPAGSIIVMDRGYVDYSLFKDWTEEGVYFVSRLKDNATYRVIKNKEVPERGNILKDHLIELRGQKANQLLMPPLRRIEVWDAENKQILALLTNHPTFGATTIAKIYKDRWQIEIFFKTLKQNLKVKTFVGTSPNALLTQIWTALIAILLLKYLQYRSKFNWSLSNLVAMLRYNFFTYRDLWTWIDNPYNLPPIIQQSDQLTFGFA